MFARLARRVQIITITQALHSLSYISSCSETAVDAERGELPSPIAKMVSIQHRLRLSGRDEQVTADRPQQEGLNEIENLMITLHATERKVGEYDDTLHVCGVHIENFLKISRDPFKRETSLTRSLRWFIATLYVSVFSGEEGMELTSKVEQVRASLLERKITHRMSLPAIKIPDRINKVCKKMRDEVENLDHPQSVEFGCRICLKTCSRQCIETLEKALCSRVSLKQEFCHRWNCLLYQCARTNNNKCIRRYGEELLEFSKQVEESDRDISAMVAQLESWDAYVVRLSTLNR
jgi:hypothetical protein